MSKSVNSVTLLGNVGQIPETRTLSNGTAVTTISLATNERKKSGNDWVDHTEWHSVTFFGRLSDVVKQYVRKGSKIYICGRLRTSSWEDNQQIKRWKTCIVAEELVLLDSKDAGQSTPPEESYNEAF